MTGVNMNMCHAPVPPRPPTACQTHTLTDAQTL